MTSAAERQGQPKSGSLGESRGGLSLSMSVSRSLTLHGTCDHDYRAMMPEEVVGVELWGRIVDGEGGETWLLEVGVELKDLTSC